MNSIRKAVSASALVFAAVTAANATYVQSYTSDMTTTVSTATVYTFDDGLKPAGYSGEGSILNTSVRGSAAPAGDSSYYLSVAYPLRSGTETFVAAPGVTYNYFGLYWGSIDEYNTLSFFNGDSLVASISGLDVIANGATLGDQIAEGSNRYVNFHFTDVTFDRVAMSTTNFAFETDNHAYASVPEPATVGLLGFGLLGLAFVNRRRALLRA